MPPVRSGERFWKASPAGVGKQEAEIEVRADALLDRFNLTHMRNEFAGTMSGGQRKLVEMARALMTEPKLVMLDEPMAGVNPALTQSLLGHVKGLRAEGRTVIFVEHDMDVVRDISDWVVVMAEGRIIAEGTPDDIGANQDVIDAYLGPHTTATSSTRSRSRGDPREHPRRSRERGAEALGPGRRRQRRREV